MQASWLSQSARILKTSNIRWYWANSTVSAFGDSVTSIALLLLVYRETGSISAMAAMATVVAVPSIVFGVLSGVWVDRWNAKHVVVASQLVRALIVLGFVYVDLGHAFWLIYLLAFLQATVGTFDDPARARVVREITDDTTRISVNSFTSSAVMIAGILGTTVGGALVGALDRYWPSFAIDSASFVVGALAFSRMTGEFVPEPATSDDASGHGFWPEVLQGFRVTRQSSVLMAVMLAASTATLGLSGATIMLLPLVTNVLDIQPGWLGAVEASQSVAMILASLTIGFFGTRIDPKRLVSLALAAIGLGVAALSVAPGLWFLLPAMFVIGLAHSPLGTAYSTLLQTYCPPRFIGRVAATMNTSIQTMSLLAMAAAGVAGDVIGVRPTMAVAGALCVLAAGFAGSLLKRSVERAVESPTTA